MVSPRGQICFEILIISYLEIHGKQKGFILDAKD